MTSSPRIAVIVVAAGRGERARTDGNAVPKQYRAIAGVPLLTRTIDALIDIAAIDWVLPVINTEHDQRYADLALEDQKLLDPVAGGATRQASCLAGLEALEEIGPDVALIHDAARPFVDARLVAGVLEALRGHDAALPVLAVTDTIKRSADGIRVSHTEDRRSLYAAQTPQAFRFEAILSAHRRAIAEHDQFTDDAAIAEWAGMSVGLAPGSAANIKITVPEDFTRAARLLIGDHPTETRVGSGFDVHPFAPGDAVFIGGVRIPHTARLKGHSDADVGLHAIADALYGALGEGDIGTHFPPSDPQWKGADSAVFLHHAVGLVASRRGRIVNLDLTIVCEAPRIRPHVDEMRTRIGVLAGIAPSRVAIKATTSERLGFTGREEGIVAMATASIELPRDEA